MPSISISGFTAIVDCGFSVRMRKVGSADLRKVRHAKADRGTDDLQSAGAPRVVDACDTVYASRRPSPVDAVSDAYA